MFILPLERKSPVAYADINFVQFLISAMSDDLPSRMIRVPTPLVDAVRELSRLHRQGRSKAVLEGIQKLITAIDSNTVIDIDSISETISKLTERLDRLEARPTESRPDIDIDSVTQMISGVSQRLEKVESDLTAIALTIQDLSTRVSSLEGVGDIGYAVTPLSELEALFDSRSDIEMTAELEDIDSDIASIAQPLEPLDISTDSVKIAELTTPYPPDRCRFFT
jgi:chromosome segregation ATPase